MTTPARALLDILRDEGVDRVFGNPGTTELPLLDVLDLPYVLGLHEGGVVAMADGYARATGRPAFVSLHAAAGLANGLIGLLNARRSGTPLVVTAGQQDRRHLLYDPMLAGDLVGLARPATKWAVDVHHEADLPVLLRRAFVEAARPPAGPVFLAVPMDLLAAETDVAVPPRSPVPRPGVADGLASVATRLAAAAHPAIVAGDAVGRERAVPELVEVAEALGAAVHHQPMADGVNFPTGHPLYQGMPAPNAADLRGRLSPYDVILIVGTPAFTAHHYTPGPYLPAAAEAIQLDSDPAVLGRNMPVAVALHGGLRPTLRALADRLAGSVPAAAGRTAQLAAAGTERRDAVDAEARALYGPPPLAPLAAMHAVAAGLPSDAVVVEEAITAGLLLRRVLRQDRPGSYLHTIGGGLGWGIGAAIGARMGDPTRPVVAVLGDGCAAFGLQALWTAAHERVPVTFVVVANQEYRTLKDTLDRMKGSGRYLGLDLRPPPLDWDAAGRTFGVPAVRPAGCAELTDLIRGCRDREGPLLVHVPVEGHG